MDKTPLHYACEKSHLPVAEYLISKGANINAKDAVENNVIHFATIGGLFPIIQYLIEQQNVDIDLKGFREQTPLHCACRGGNLQIAEYLISKGANINAKDGNGDYIIHCASHGALISIVQYLIEQQNINIDIKGYYKKTPLHYVCEGVIFQLLNILFLMAQTSMQKINVEIMLFILHHLVVFFQLFNI